MNLRWSAAAAAADAAARLDVENSRYRDAEGTWWTVAGGRWQAWRAGAWHAAAPPEWVEGPASDLPAAIAPSRPAASAAETPAQEPAPAIAAAVGRIAAAYQHGLLTSDAAEAALSELYVVDVDGSLWTVGVRSGRWQRFNDGRWQRSDAEPDQARLLDQQALAGDTPPAVVAGLAAFLGADDPVPEAITEPWLPAESVAPQVLWRPTHRVPQGGLAAWERPDANARSFGSLSEGLEVSVIERAGAWAHVARPGGTTCWVDGRLLVAL